VTKGSTGHYFLSLFLAQHGMQLSDVVLVDLDAASVPKALIDGTVDAVSTWEPYIYSAKKSLQDNGLVLESRDTFREDFYFVVFSEWVNHHPNRTRRFLFAIDEAEKFIADHPLESQKIVAKRLKLDPQFVASVWGDYTFELFLDQAILLTLEQQARWSISNGFTDHKTAPNYLNFITTEMLEAIKPSAVTIIQ